MAIALWATIFIFPETMNHSCLTAISDQLGRIKALMVLQDDVLSSAPADLAPGTSLLTRINSARASLIVAQKECKFAPDFHHGVLLTEVVTSDGFFRVN